MGVADMATRVSLDSLESSWKSDQKTKARKVAPPGNLLLTGLLSAFVSPFVLAVSIFVPFFGQVLCLLLVSLCLVYLWIKRSLLLAASMVLGTAAGLGVVGFVATIFQREAAGFYFVVLTFSVFVTVCAIGAVVGGVVRHYESGRGV